MRLNLDDQKKNMYIHIETIESIAVKLLENEKYEELEYFIAFFDVWSIMWICRRVPRLGDMLQHRCTLRIIENSDIDVLVKCDIPNQIWISPYPKWNTRDYANVFKQSMLNRLMEGKTAKVYLIVSSCPLTDLTLKKLLFYSPGKFEMEKDCIEASYALCIPNESTSQEQRVTFHSVNRKKYIDDQFYFDVQSDHLGCVVATNKKGSFYPYISLVLVTREENDNNEECVSMIRLSSDFILPNELVSNVDSTRNKKYTSVMNRNNKIIYADMLKYGDKDIGFDESVDDMKLILAKSLNKGLPIHFSIGSISLPLISMLNCSISPIMYENRIRNLQNCNARLEDARKLREAGIELSTMQSLPLDVIPAKVGSHPRLDKQFECLVRNYLQQQGTQQQQ